MVKKIYDSEVEVSRGRGRPIRLSMDGVKAALSEKVDLGTGQSDYT